MDIYVFNNDYEASQYAADIVRETLVSGTEVFGLATGSTPEKLYKILTETDLDFSQATAINLDEYYGLAPDNEQSYAYFMHKYLFSGKKFGNFYIPNGLNTNAEEETSNYDNIIENNPIDLQLLGIGVNGHFGFNEPGSPLDSKTRLVDLTSETIQANRRFFNSIDEVPTQAYSMGVSSVMGAKRIVMLAFGEQKAKAVQMTAKGPVTAEVPASILQTHSNSIIILDQAAAQFLDPSDYQTL